MNPILVEVYRGKVLESFHRGVVCIVDRDGKIIYQEGNVQQVCYPRSALKFFQQIPFVSSGAAEAIGLTEEEIAVTCGSHNGEDQHVQVVDSILKKAGLDRSALKCGPQFPSHRKTANALIAAGKKPEAIHNNCSGKHAGFLAYSVYLGYATDNYIDPNHPVQKEIRSLTSAFHDVPENQMEIALDGCSAPIYSIPVYNQALAYMRLSHPDFGNESWRKACKTLIQAARNHPMMIAGTGRYCTDLIATAEKELIGKTGAEGIYSLSFHKKIIGATIKIDDGKMLPQYNVAQKLVGKSGLFSAEELAQLHSYLCAPITNFNKWETGHIQVADSILTKNWL
ncbi:MAG: asparaginase [Bacteroidetes bacterium]|nr:asparaginase [Bacteroidota bacterium]